MKNYLLNIVVAACGTFGALTPAAAGLLTFDDLNTGGAGAVANSYGGLTFNGWWHIDSPPFSYPNQSPPTAIYNSESAYTNMPEILSGDQIDVLSVYLADYSNGGSVTLLGYLGATELYSQTVTINTSSMTQHTLNFVGIDRFVMQTNNGSYVFLDNFDFQSTSNVPEPATLALVGLGLIGAVGIRSRRQCAKLA